MGINLRRYCLWRAKPQLWLTLSILCLALWPGLCAAQANPASFSDVAAKATAARDANDLPGAIELYQQALKLNSQWPDGSAVSALCNTLPVLTLRPATRSRIISISVPMQLRLAMRGLCEFEIADYGLSLKDIERALALGAANQPRNEKILRYHDALLLTRAGRFEDALRSYAFFASDPDPNPELLLALGLAGLRTPLLPKELKTDQRDLYIAAGKATFTFMKRDLDAARVEFEQLLDRVPPVPNIHYLYGYLLYATDPDQAMIEFKGAGSKPIESRRRGHVGLDSSLQNDGSRRCPRPQSC